jgi:alpha-N-arabinofuranosidase
MSPEINELADYLQCMAFTSNIDHAVSEVRGLLQALKLDKKIKIAFDEWNLRSWHHPNVHPIKQGSDKAAYVLPRDKNDDNSQYTMADAVFTACFLSAMNRNCDIVGMANFAPILNTRGCIFSHDDGIVLRSTYHVFDLYVNYLGDTIIDLWSEGQLPLMRVTGKNGVNLDIDTVDLLATSWSDRPGLAIAAINKDPDNYQILELNIGDISGQVSMYSICGSSVDSYNDVGRNEIFIERTELGIWQQGKPIELAPHSVNIIQIM